MCYSCKWLGEDYIFHDNILESDHHSMILGVHKLIEEADAVIHYNGNRFDLPILNREFIEHGLMPPAPYRSIDLLSTVRNKFRFVSNKLDYVCEKLGLGKKHETTFKLWVDCMELDEKAWKQMKEYNINDVELLERLYFKLRPWIHNPPNVGLYQEDALVCPSCGSKHYQKRGFHYTNAYKWQRYQCQAKDCMSWFKSAGNLGPKPSERFTFINA